MQKLTDDKVYRVTTLQPKDAIIVDNTIIRFERINEAFMSGQLKYYELVLLGKKFPRFHAWFISTHRKVFA